MQKNTKCLLLCMGISITVINTIPVLATENVTDEINTVSTDEQTEDSSIVNEVPDVLKVSENGTVSEDQTEQQKNDDSSDEKEIETYTVSNNGDGVYIFGRTIKTFDIDEYRKTRGAQQTNFLTNEQIDEGWILFDGWAYPPNDTENSELLSYIRGYEEDDSENEGQTVITVDVENGISNGVYLKITNAMTYRDYTIEFYPAEGYQKTLNLPVGTYLISDGGFIDYDRPSVCSESNFKVLKQNITNVRVAVRTRDYLMLNGDEDIVSANNASAEDFAEQITLDEKEKQEKVASIIESQNEIAKKLKEEKETLFPLTNTGSKNVQTKISGTIILIVIVAAIGLIIGFIAGKYFSIYEYNTSDDTRDDTGDDNE